MVMQVLMIAKARDNYDTTINIIGGISDCELIYSAIDAFFCAG